MAATASVKRSAALPGFYSITEITCDSSYPEGGYSVSASALGLQTVDMAFCTIINGTEAAEKWVAESWYTTSNSKLHLQDAKTGKELAAAVNCEKVKVQVVALGKSRSK